MKDHPLLMRTRSTSSSIEYAIVPTGVVSKICIFQQYRNFIRIKFLKLTFVMTIAFNYFENLGTDYFVCDKKKYLTSFAVSTSGTVMMVPSITPWFL